MQQKIWIWGLLLIVLPSPPFSFVLIENKNLAPIILHALETWRLDYKAESVYIMVIGYWLVWMSLRRGCLCVYHLREN